MEGENEGESMGMRYTDIGKSIGLTVEQKNEAYGDSFNKSGEVLRILYPDGVGPDEYDDMLAVVRVVDKLFRIATDKKALKENPWKDITGYGILAVGRDMLEPEDHEDNDFHGDTEYFPTFCPHASRS